MPRRANTVGQCATVLPVSGIAATGPATVLVDLRPDMAQPKLAQRLARVPAAQSLANTLRKGAGLGPVAVNLLREAGPVPSEPESLAAMMLLALRSALLTAREHEVGLRVAWQVE